MIGIIGAMDIEVENLKEQIKDVKIKRISGIDFYYGTIFQREVVLAKCGIGKVFASLCAQTMIIEFNIDCLINTGVAGTLTNKLSIKDIAVSSCVVQHDMDTSPLGDPVGLLSGINKVFLPASEKLILLAEEAIKEQGLNYLVGNIASGDQFIASSEKKSQIANNFNAIACEMEGGAIGHVAYVNNVEFIVIRAISDDANNDSSIKYSDFVSIAAKNSTNITLNLIKRI